MKTYKIPVSWTMAGTVVIEASSYDEACEKIDRDEFDVSEVMSNGSYIEDSFQIDHDFAIDQID